MTASKEEPIESGGRAPESDGDSTLRENGAGCGRVEKHGAGDNPERGGLARKHY